MTQILVIGSPRRRNRTLQYVTHIAPTTSQNEK